MLHMCLFPWNDTENIALQMKMLRIFCPINLQADLLELFFPMSVLLALEPFYLVIILGTNFIFVEYEDQWTYNADIQYFFFLRNVSYYEWQYNETKQINLVYWIYLQPHHVFCHISVLCFCSIFFLFLFWKSNSCISCI